MSNMGERYTTLYSYLKGISLMYRVIYLIYFDTNFLQKTSKFITI